MGLPGTNEVDDYISKFPSPVNDRLQHIREIIKSEGPHLNEGMKWGNPAYSSETIMVILAGYKHHIGLHATKTVIESLQDKLANYKTTAGSVQFSHDKPIPVDLVREILRSRIEEYKKHGVLWK